MSISYNSPCVRVSHSLRHYPLILLTKNNTFWFAPHTGSVQPGNVGCGSVNSIAVGGKGVIQIIAQNSAALPFVFENLV